MSSNFLFLQAQKNKDNKDLLASLEKWANDGKTQVYVIDKPLGDNKYSYDHDGAIIILVPKKKIAVIDFSGDAKSFDNFYNDIIEDTGFASDKYRYKEIIGRPRQWRDYFVGIADGARTCLEDLLSKIDTTDYGKQRTCDLLISLLTGSINNVDKVKATIPQNVLDKVKQKILLFDGDQTRFIYHTPEKSPVRIQGLSGTGKTELLLHKLKELYINKPNSRIAFTCHNKILASNMRSRIPEFFNFMKVDQQIEWDKTIWCNHAWGSQYDINSGIYRYICEYYHLPFQRYGKHTSFEKACKDALAILKDDSVEFAFDYMLIDESQDFPDAFFLLCQKATRNTVYIAGDIFQNIFQAPSDASISPDFLLSKCYRTDPRTLMFAHALGMGLFEREKKQWLEDAEWQACGYIIDKMTEPGFYLLKREPLRRFEDISDAKMNSVEMVAVDGDFTKNASDAVISIISGLMKENEGLSPNDVGVILLDDDNGIYAFADILEQVIPTQIGWGVNKAYETKEKLDNSLFVSNRNNVKGLEFPFVICVTRHIDKSYTYRNALYMTMTRSFLRSYILLSKEENAAITPQIKQGLDIINFAGYIKTKEPTEAEKDKIRTTIIKYSNLNKTIPFYDLVTMVINELRIPQKFHDKIHALANVMGEDFDYEDLKESINVVYQKMR